MARSHQRQIVSSIPSPVCLEVPCSCQTPEEMQRTATALGAGPQVEDVRASIQMGSILVHYDRERGEFDHLRPGLVGTGT